MFILIYSLRCVFFAESQVCPILEDTLLGYCIYCRGIHVIGLSESCTLISDAIRRNLIGRLHHQHQLSHSLNISSWLRPNVQCIGLRFIRRHI